MRPIVRFITVSGYRNPKTPATLLQRTGFVSNVLDKENSGRRRRSVGGLRACETRMTVITKASKPAREADLERHHGLESSKKSGNSKTRKEQAGTARLPMARSRVFSSWSRSERIAIPGVYLL